MKPNYNRKQFVGALRKMGIKKGDVVFTHSNIGYFGIPEEGKNVEVVFKNIFDAFQDVIGQEGTLVVPTFSLSFCKLQPYDPETTPTFCGIFAEMLRQLPGSCRSNDPLFSVAAFGKQAKKLTSNISQECFGKDSFWERFMNSNGIICNMNFDSGSTFIHYVEKCLNVPYRYDKFFAGTVIKKGEVHKSSAIFYCQDISNSDTVAWFELFDKLARKRGIVKNASIGRGEITVITAKDTYEFIKKEIKINPWFLTVAGKEGRNPVLLKNSEINENVILLDSSSSMKEKIDRLWKLPRNIISDGYDTALFSLAKLIDMKIHKYPTGTHCWTWIIPEKWTCREAYLETLDGKKLFAYADNPLHIGSYSLSFEGIVSKKELFKHLHTHDIPEAIPYMCKYYERDWDLCCSKALKDSFQDEKYKVVIKTDFSFGELKVGEIIIPGEKEESVILCAHLCHPAMVNDDLVGVIIGIEVIKELKRRKGLHYTYRFLIVPETIGSIAYLSNNENIISKLKYGIFLEMLGNDNIHALQLTRQGNTRLDRIARYVMKGKLKNFREGSFRKVVCNDEMVFNGPGCDIPMISISRFPYPEYHSSHDNPDIITEERLEESKNLVLEILTIFDNDYIPKRCFKGPIFLSRYGLWVDWRTNQKLNENVEQIMLRLEGDKSIFDISEELNMDFYDVLNYMNSFYKEGLIVKIDC